MLKSAAKTTETADRWHGPSGQILVNIKNTSSVRDVRGAFLALAYLIVDEPTENIAVCVLVGTRLSPKRLREELVRFRQVVHPVIAQRIHFLLGKGEPPHKDPAFVGSMDHAPGEFLNWLTERVTSEASNDLSLQLPARQIVIAALAQLCLCNEPAVTVKYLQELCRVSYPTVAVVLNDMNDRGWLENSGKRGVRMRSLIAGEWMELAGDHTRQRKVCLFTDPTGQTSPERLVKRLAILQDAGKLTGSIRIGGVIGASHHFPAIDITAAPRLDLSVGDDPGKIAALLDAGLSPKTRPEQRVTLAIHVTNDPWDLTSRPSMSKGPWAGVLECLADLVEMGFTREAMEMAQHVERVNRLDRNGQ